MLRGRLSKVKEWLEPENIVSKEMCDRAVMFIKNKFEVANE